MQHSQSLSPYLFRSSLVSPSTLSSASVDFKVLNFETPPSTPPPSYSMDAREHLKQVQGNVHNESFTLCTFDRAKNRYVPTSLALDQTGSPGTPLQDATTAQVTPRKRLFSEDKGVKRRGVRGCEDLEDRLREVRSRCL